MAILGRMSKAIETCPPSCQCAHSAQLALHLMRAIAGEKGITVAVVRADEICPARLN